MKSTRATEPHRRAPSAVPKERPADVPYGYCWCKCGGKTGVYTATNRAVGHVKGEHKRFISGHHARLTRPDGKGKRIPVPERFWAKVDKTPGQGPSGDCHLWTASVQNKGYGQFTIEYGVVRLAHRVAYELSVGPCEGLVLRHSCDTPRCCNVAHLTTGTKKENSEDMVARKRHRYGMRATHRKLTEDEVVEIRRAYAAGEASTNELGRKFGVCGSNVWHIVNRDTWKLTP